MVACLVAGHVTKSSIYAGGFQTVCDAGLQSEDSKITTRNDISGNFASTSSQGLYCKKYLEHRTYFFQKSREDTQSFGRTFVASIETAFL